MKVKVAKIFKNLVSVRDYQAEKCIKDNEPLQIEFSGKVMTIDPFMIRSKIKVISQNKFQSKWDNVRYQLYDFEFKPDQMELFV